MARTPRRNMNDSSFFHIMVQGINREYIFNTKANMKKYLDLIYKNNDKINIIAYCIMNNHAHFLIQTDEVCNIEYWMKKSNTSYAKYYNKKNERVGYVFRDRYKMQIIKDEKYLYTCVKYIHDNPVKAGIVEDKAEYEFSSYRKIYLNDEEKLMDELSRILNGNIIRNSKIEDDFEFIEEEEIDKEQICKNTIEEFIKRENINNIYSLRVNKDKLKEITKILKYDNQISYRIMGKYLKVSRETLRKLLI